MSYLRYLCLFVYSSVQHILCCVFALFFFVSSMLPISLDCPFLIAPFVFSNVNSFVDSITDNTTCCFSLKALTAGIIL